MRRTGMLIASGVLAAVALLALLGSARPAFADPDPTLGLSDLQAKLSASPTGTVPGYFKTVDAGSTIETIPVTIMAITAGGGATGTDGLILFQATGPKIDKFGGIVAGMSGSPIYVDDVGTDKVVGAVSYGDYFTIGGLGLATPIESMLQVKTAFVAASRTLPRPIVTGDGVVRSVIVAPNPQDYSAEAKAGAFVARPLASVFIGGLRPSSTGYKALAQMLEKRGMNVVALSSAVGAPAIGDQSFTTTLVPGAAVAAMEARGDMWLGDVGTVTYTDTDSVLAFGHPALWGGPSSLYMTNAWIDGVWSSTEEPYKLARPGGLQGSITQDRSAGILGVLGQIPAEATITAHALNADTGKSASSQVLIPRAMLDSGSVDPFTAAIGTYIAGTKLMDALQIPGSAILTTTVLATDGTTTYTISMPNRVDDGYDVTFAALQDVATAVSTLQQVPTDGVQRLDILSIDLTAEYTSRRNWAKIVGVDLPKGLKVGANPVEVSALVFGQPATQTIDTTLNVPAGTPLTGDVAAVSESYLKEWQDSGGYGESIIFGDMGDGISISIPREPSRLSLAAAASQLNAAVPNNAMLVAYVPRGSDGGGDYPGEIPDLQTAAASKTLPSDSVFIEAVAAATTQVTARAFPSTVNYGGGSVIAGTVSGPQDASAVDVYATPAGGAEQFVGTFPTQVVYDEQSDESSLQFIAPTSPLVKSTLFRIHYNGNGDYASSEALVSVHAHARVALKASATGVTRGKTITLSASVSPTATAGGQVVFEYNSSGSTWRTIAKKTLAAGSSAATAATPWKVVPGAHKVRARYLGGVTNLATTSNSVVVTGR